MIVSSASCLRVFPESCHRSLPPSLVILQVLRARVEMTQKCDSTLGIIVTKHRGCRNGVIALRNLAGGRHG